MAPTPGELPSRIVVVGCGGSGKTVLANELGSLLEITVTHLDPLLHDKDWRVTPPAEFRRRQAAILAKAAWIMDGTYPRTLAMRIAAADTVILLDLPTARCLLGVVRRRLRYGRGQHAEGVFGTASLRFLRHVMKFGRNIRPKVLAAIAEHGTHARLVHLTSHRQVNAYLASLRAMRNTRRAHGPATVTANRGHWP